MISINNVINIQANLPGRGLSSYNTANILLLTTEESESGEEYGIHLGSNTVKDEYGTASEAFKMAQTVFSQSPNIKNNNGYLVVATMVPASFKVVMDAEPTDGKYDLAIGDFTESIPFDATGEEIRALFAVHPGLETIKVVKTSTDTTFIIPSLVGAVPSATASGITLTDGVTPVAVTVEDIEAGESVLEAIMRLKTKVDFTGILEAFSIDDAQVIECAAWFQDFENRGIHIVASGDTDDLEPETGLFAKVLDGSFTRTRCLFKTGTLSERNAFKAAYASRMMSPNFSAFDSTITAHLKDLVNVQPDSNIDQTVLEKIKAVGADCYPSIQGIPKVFTSGKNWFFDRVHNLLWFIGACQVAYFNILAKTSTKIAQTEAGVTVLIGAVTRVCDQAVNNGYIAPGEWTGEIPFGDTADFARNIREKGYYIFTAPVALQSPEDREERKAPVMQIAIKEAGAIHSGNVIVNINP